MYSTYIEFLGTGKKFLEIGVRTRLIPYFRSPGIYLKFEIKCTNKLKISVEIKGTEVIVCA